MSFLSNSPFRKGNHIYPTQRARGVTMSNHARLGSFNASNVNVDSIFGGSVPQDQDGSAYSSMYNMQSGSIPVGQPFESLNTGSPWPFHMGAANNLQEHHHTAAKAAGMLPNTLRGNFTGYPDANAHVTGVAQHGAGGTNGAGGVKSESTSNDRELHMPQTPITPASLGMPHGMNDASAFSYPDNRGIPRHASIAAIPQHTATSVKPGGGGHANDGGIPHTPNNAGSSQGPSSARASAKKRSTAKGEKDSRTGRRKIKIEFIDDDSRRHITFSKRKAGIMKKAYELATLTGTQVLLLVVSQTGLVYTFTTPKLEAVVKQPEGRNLIQECLNAPDPSEGGSGTGDANQAESGPSSEPFDRNVNYTGAELGDDQDEDDEEEDEDGLDIGHADAGLTTQAINSPLAARDNGSNTLGGAGATAAPLFHPGWAPSSSGQSARQMDVNNPPSSIKRRRTQPNLSRTAVQHTTANLDSTPDLPTQFYQSPTSMMPTTMPMNRVVSNDALLNTTHMPMFLGHGLGHEGSMNAVASTHPQDITGAKGSMPSDNV